MAHVPDLSYVYAGQCVQHLRGLCSLNRKWCMQAEEVPEDAPGDLLEAYVKEQARPGTDHDPIQ